MKVLEALHWGGARSRSLVLQLLRVLAVESRSLLLEVLPSAAEEPQVVGEVEGPVATRMPLQLEGPLLEEGPRVDVHQTGKPKALEWRTSRFHQHLASRVD